MSQITRQFLIEVAEASRAEVTSAMGVFIARMKQRPRYAAATEDEIEAFDVLLDAMEDDDRADKWAPPGDHPAVLHITWKGN
jgi:hypothetical protein